MKKLLLVLAVVGTTLFTACNKDNNECDHDFIECDHDFIEHDYSKALVGTWTSLEDNGMGEAIQIEENGSFTITGTTAGGVLRVLKGTVTAVNNKITLSFDGSDTLEGRLELVEGVSMSIIFLDEFDFRKTYTYHYCKEDLSDEIVGMWVSHDTPIEGENEMMIETFYDNGSCSLTGFLPIEGNSEQVLNNQTDYKVVGDLLFIAIPGDNAETDQAYYIVHKIVYTPNASTFGDVISLKAFAKVGEEYVETSTSWLRVKQTLDLENKQYDYSNVYVSNVKGLDKDIEFMGYTMNFSKMDGSELDKLLKTTLFNIEFPAADTIKYTYYYKKLEVIKPDAPADDEVGEATPDTPASDEDNKETPNASIVDVTKTFDAPIVVEGNKMTIKMSKKESTLKDVVLYAFQDAKNTQIHFYMSKNAFVDFHTNMQAILLESTDEEFDIKNADAVNAIYDNIRSAVETINVSFVFKARN